MKRAVSPDGVAEEAFVIGSDRKGDVRRLPALSTITSPLYWIVIGIRPNTRGTKGGPHKMTSARVGAVETL